MSPGCASSYRLRHWNSYVTVNGLRVSYYRVGMYILQNMSRIRTPRQMSMLVSWLLPLPQLQHHFPAGSAL